MVPGRWPWARPARKPAGDVAVILVHGYVCMSRVLYWQGLQPLRRELVAAGYPVIRSCQPRTGAVAFRAQHLARFLDRVPHARLILVGHSMGGLDARYAASRLDPARRISHVVTIGTPHKGTALADWALGDSEWLSRLARFIDRGALHDLSLAGAERLNAEMPDRSDVGYVSLAGACHPELLVGTLRRLGARLAQDEGANDGLVSLHSALRGHTQVSLSANHMELIGHRLLTCPEGWNPVRLGQPLTALRAVLTRILAQGAA